MVYYYYHTENVATGLDYFHNDLYITHSHGNGLEKPSPVYFQTGSVTHVQFTLVCKTMFQYSHH